MNNCAQKKFLTSFENFENSYFSESLQSAVYVELCLYSSLTELDANFYKSQFFF